MGKNSTDLDADNTYKSEYFAGRDNVQIYSLDVHYPVFIISSVSFLLLVFFALVFRDLAASVFENLRICLTTWFDWIFMTGVNGFFLFCFCLIVSPHGKVRIGGQDAKPEHSYFEWLAMLFAAGMGMGLVFFGVLEPVNHTLKPPLGALPPLDSKGVLDAAMIIDSQRIGMAATFFHWSLHPWATYSIVALGLAIFCYNKKLPLTIRSAFYPILGERTWDWPGHIIDISAVFATIAGLSVSLGFGAEQASGGLGYIFNFTPDITIKIIIITVVVAVALVSIIRGLDRGIKLLSIINIIMAFVLMIIVFSLGPTIKILTSFFSNIGAYIVELPGLSNWIGREDTDYYHGWTTLYWAWWISWSPFVGLFIARISKGRTVREFLLCVILIPSLVCTIWMTVFGTTALDQFISNGYTGVINTVYDFTPELSLFKMLDELPLTELTSLLGILLVLIFFITSLDSSALVIDMITSGGKTNTPIVQRVLWCSFEAIVAIALLVGGGLSALQAFAIAMGLPFCLILIIMCFSIWKGLCSEIALAQPS